MLDSNITEMIINNEAIRYISSRHHCDAHRLITQFLATEAACAGSISAIKLEPNEIEIIKNLIDRYTTIKI